MATEEAETNDQVIQNSSTRNLLARLDLAIIDLEEQQRVGWKIRQMADEHASAVAEIRGRLMLVRDDLRPILDDSAPRRYPYDKRDS